ncbi:unnamed protein product [Coccothraustes coccothraustes]
MCGGRCGGDVGTRGGGRCRGRADARRGREPPPSPVQQRPRAPVSSVPACPGRGRLPALAGSSATRIDPGVPGSGAVRRFERGPAGCGCVATSRVAALRGVQAL